VAEAQADRLDCFPSICFAWPKRWFFPCPYFHVSTRTTLIGREGIEVVFPCSCFHISTSTTLFGRERGSLFFSLSFLPFTADPALPCPALPCPALPCCYRCARGVSDPSSLTPTTPPRATEIPKRGVAPAPAPAPIDRSTRFGHRLTCLIFPRGGRAGSPRRKQGRGERGEGAATQIASQSHKTRRGQPATR